MSMQATAYSARDLASTGMSDDRRTGWWSRVAKNFIAAQERAARVRAARELSHLSDAHLNALGLDTDDIKALRDTGVLR
ncbi:MAG: hypothetical protein AAFR23_00975 [Pseudomonadota bacterium]